MQQKQRPSKDPHAGLEEDAIALLGKDLAAVTEACAGNPVKAPTVAYGSPPDNSRQWEWREPQSLAVNTTIETTTVKCRSS